MNVQKNTLFLFSNTGWGHTSDAVSIRQVNEKTLFDVAGSEITIFKLLSGKSLSIPEEIEAFNKQVVEEEEIKDKKRREENENRRFNDDNKFINNLRKLFEEDVVE